MALTEDCLYSQPIKMVWCCDQGVLRIPILSIKDIRQEPCKNYFIYNWLKTNDILLDFNDRYRIDHPHMVINYIITDSKGKKEYKAGWQMNDVTYNQWKTAIEKLRNSHPANELA